MAFKNIVRKTQRQPSHTHKFIFSRCANISSRVFYNQNGLQDMKTVSAPPHNRDDDEYTYYMYVYTRRASPSSVQGRDTGDDGHHLSFNKKIF
jgi:hypothetical protein